jgi:hypothetical protein
MPDALSTSLLIVVAFCVSVLSWQFIEKPFRAKPFRMGSIGTIGVAGGAMAATALLAYISVPLNSKLWHYNTAESNIMSYMNYKSTEMRYGTCFLDLRSEDLKFFQAAHCLDMNSNKKNYLIVGDSHAADLWYGLSNEYPTINFLQATVPSCEPIMGNSSGKCGNMLKYIFNNFIPAHHLDGIILSANWLSGDFRNTISTAQKLKQYSSRVIIFGPCPEYDQPLPLLLARAMIKANMKIVFNHLLKDRKVKDENLSKLATDSGVEYVSVYSILCPGDACTTTVGDNVPILFDTDHFTAAGSEFLAAKVKLLSGATK